MLATEASTMHAGTVATTNSTCGHMPRPEITAARRIVLKLGTRVLTHDDGRIAVARLSALLATVAGLHAAGREVVIVTSGAVGVGKGLLGLDDVSGSAPLRCACAAVGQAHLLDVYHRVLDGADLVMAQVLIAQGEFDDPERTGGLKAALETLLARGVVPVLNENDAVGRAQRPSTEAQLTFEDNDRLAALIAGVLEADLLVLLTDVDGVYAENPQPAGGGCAVVDRVDDVDALAGLGGPASPLSLGGMRGKVASAVVARDAGCEVVIASGRRLGVLSHVMAGEALGTWFPAGPRPAQSAAATPALESIEAASLARSVRRAQRVLGALPATARTRALEALAVSLRERQDKILEANARDLASAAEDGLEASLVSRLRLTLETLAGLAEGVRQLATADDPIGAVRRMTALDDGLTLRQVASPIGVLMIIFESRPDAVIQIGALALRSGNGLILKGGREARHSNRVLADCLRQALEVVGVDSAAIADVESREAVHALLDCDEDIDLVIPRGSGTLVKRIQASTRIPVLGHAEGICHVYLHAAADPATATAIVVDSKCDYPSACNAVETLLIDRAFLPQLPVIGRALEARGVQIKADSVARAHLPMATLAEVSDFRTEWCGPCISVRVVDGLDSAIDHIHRFGSGHTEAIVTRDAVAARRFHDEVDSASVFVNASTRFADGYRYGLGAEVGIATGRIHARGPVGVDGLMTTRWLLEGDGHLAADYTAGRRTFVHRPLSV